MKIKVYEIEADCVERLRDVVGAAQRVIDAWMNNDPLTCSLVRLNDAIRVAAQAHEPPLRTYTLDKSGGRDANP